ncbi:LysR family transcriptional regulator [Haloechinothrix sp. LS1_15]|uniref:LysR family transcriptional regulator n=1 Tax=Haloechinothrix sp. LS1_15 TaxID=2652248 RepID=UPI002947C954|nr:LysR family transcriptional regulator [Haloechinothrix sp. LS1_15]MDV6014208.1 LysR family transcriptional regulator [Haloechinothrix sp. LS1_15]
MELETRHLRVVCAVAEHSSLTRAAAALGMSQPNLTRQLQRLERALGGELFVRHERGTTPTEFGSYVLARARAVLPVLDELAMAAMYHSGGSARPDRVRYGASHGPLGSRMLPPLRTLLPSVEITLLTEYSNALLCDLVAGGFLELAALLEFPGYEVPNKPELHRAVAGTAPMCVLLTEDHPLAARSEINLVDLAGEDWVIVSRDDNRFREYLTVACREHGFAPTVRYEADPTDARDLIRGGIAIGLGQSTFRASTGIAARPLAGDPFWEKNVLVWHRAGPLAELGDRLLAAAREVLHEATEQSPASVARYDRDRAPHV